MKIVLVSDDATWRDRILLAANSRGHQVRVVSIESAETDAPLDDAQVLLVDTRQAREAGAAIVRRVRGPKMLTPCVLLAGTDDAESDSVDRLLASRFDDYLSIDAAHSEIATRIAVLERRAAIQGTLIHSHLHLERAHAELLAILDAVQDSIFVYDTSGNLIISNEAGRQRYIDGWGRMPRDLKDLRSLAQPATQDGQPVPLLVAERALRGEIVTEILDMKVGGPGRRRFSVRAAPLHDQQGHIQGAVVVGRDISELYEAIAASERLDGAIKTARLVAHELNNKLSLVIGYASFLNDAQGPVSLKIIREIATGAEAASGIVAQLQRIIRFEEVSTSVGPMLDLDAAISSANEPSH